MASSTDRRAPEADESNRQWSVDVPSGLPIQQVRSACRDFLLRFATADSDVASAELIIAELIANLVVHARGRGTLRFDWRERRPELLVLDDGPGFTAPPHTTLAEPYAESGRGLAIVGILAVLVETGNRPEGGAFVRVRLPVERAG